MSEKNNGYAKSVDCELNALQAEQQEFHSKLSKFDQENSELMTIDGLKEYAKKCIKPGLDYYEYTFNNEDGDLFRFKKACEAAEVFDPYFLSTTPQNIIEFKVRDLSYFDHKEIFTCAFIGLLLGELSSLIRLAKDITHMDWDTVGNGSCERYNQRLVRRQARRQRRNQVVNHDNDEDNDEVNNIGEGRVDVISTYQDWKDDPGERARRISLWWKYILVTMKKKLPSFAQAYRVVCVTQVSSALIERVFSYLSKNLHTSSQNQLEKTIETRLILEVNKAVTSIDFN